MIRENGGVPVRTRVGHSFIKAVMAETGAVFGGEHSGHFYFTDFWRADSGMLAALHTIAALGGAPAGIDAVASCWPPTTATSTAGRSTPWSPTRRLPPSGSARPFAEQPASPSTTSTG